MIRDRKYLQREVLFAARKMSAFNYEIKSGSVKLPLAVVMALGSDCIFGEIFERKHNKFPVCLVAKKQPMVCLKIRSFPVEKCY